MISKNEIKYIQSLFHKKTRDAEAVFIAEGVKLVNELLESSIHIKKIYATKEWIAKHNNLKNLAEIEDYELQKISSLSTPNQVLVIADQKKLLLQPELQTNITLALDGIQDPGNLGTIIRIADWFGITQIVASEDTVDVYNSKVVQSTMGSIIRVNVWYKNLNEWLSNCNVPVYGAMLNGTSIHDYEIINEGVLVIGGESKGIRESVQPFIRYSVTIPKKGGAESLNASVATGIILSHFTR
ncbi:MAG TPA: RNA methyltransferase [Panacibacter sp.]|nr:RNA methyltransferase [Panacibacter sp.]